MKGTKLTIFRPQFDLYIGPTRQSNTNVFWAEALPFSESTPKDVTTHREQFHSNPGNPKQARRSELR